MSEAMQRQTGQTPAWQLFSGVAIGVVGASVNKHAESVGELVVFLGSRTDNSDAPVAVALGRWGLLLLVVGAVVVLAGLVMSALAGQHEQRRRAMDPRRCSVACGRATSAPLWSAASSLVPAAPDPGNPGGACPAHHRTRD
jgi:hypothetical protein